MTKPLSFYDITDKLGKLGVWYGDPIERLQYVESFARYPDMKQFTKQELAWIKEAEENGE